MSDADQARQEARSGGYELVVHGTPAPQGSKRHVGRGIMVESSKAVGPWREAVTTAALRAGVLGLGLDGNLVVSLAFHLARPRGHYGKGRNADVLRPTAPTAPNGKPDVDKLARSTLDGLVQARVIVDDSRIVTLVALKRYLDTPAGVPGAVIGIRVIP